MLNEKERAEEVVHALDEVIDPELGIGIVSLGLVYRVAVDGSAVSILMTMTVPGCPMHETIVRDVEVRVAALPWVRDVEVTLTLDPPWTADRLSDQARSQLGNT